MVRSMLIILAAFCAMEFVSYLAHRFVYHKLLWVFHKSHHTPRTGPFEWNDVFPLFFASVSILVIWYAVGDPLRGDLLALAVGVTLYGMVYFFIHDIYVHRRIPGVVFRNSYLRRVKKAHMVHHTYGGEPYGLLLFPVKDGPTPADETGDDRTSAS
jgi:beta-carotene 3-hydroxylase